MRRVEIFENIDKMKKFLNGESSIGFVPTMGALHRGHRSLLERAREENRIVVLSIFVNPTQFLEGEDFSKYPRTLESDIEIAEEVGVDAIFLPTAENLYFSDELGVIAPKVRGFILEGERRVGHFNGVLQVVLKLFNIINPDRAYFGKKDAQQLILIQQMKRDLFLDVQIVPVEIVRDSDGVALSSRNRYLSEGERESARTIPESLKIAEEMAENGESLAKIRDEIGDRLKNLDVEYIEIIRRDLGKIEEIERGNSIILLAVKVGNTRLIDNSWI
jgi:pantoate--beta-alanine ligase